MCVFFFFVLEGGGGGGIGGLRSRCEGSKGLTSHSHFT